MGNTNVNLAISAMYQYTHQYDGSDRTSSHNQELAP